MLIYRHFDGLTSPQTSFQHVCSKANHRSALLGKKIKTASSLKSPGLCQVARCGWPLICARTLETGVGEIQEACPEEKSVKGLRGVWRLGLCLVPATATRVTPGPRGYPPAWHATCNPIKASFASFLPCLLVFPRLLPAACFPFPGDVFPPQGATWVLSPRSGQILMQ